MNSLITSCELFIERTDIIYSMTTCVITVIVIVVIHESIDIFDNIWVIIVFTVVSFSPLPESVLYTKINGPVDLWCRFRLFWMLPVKMRFKLSTTNTNQLDITSWWVINRSETHKQKVKQLTIVLACRGPDPLELSTTGQQFVEFAWKELVRLNIGGLVE